VSLINPISAWMLPAKGSAAWLIWHEFVPGWPDAGAIGTVQAELIATVSALGISMF
jgi:hypothetical protein